MSGVVHVIDDDEGVRDSLALLLRTYGFEPHPYDSAVTFLDGLASAAPGCVVTDVQMPEMTGLALLERMRARLPEFPMIVLTGQGSITMAVEALQAGASDFLEKPFDGDAICSAIRRAFDRAKADAERVGQRAAVARRLGALSPREREVLDRIVQGASNKEVARDLGISHRTVEAYRAALMVKMQAGGLSELVRMTILAGEAEASA